MSRIGKQPVKILESVSIEIDSQERRVTVRGPKGELSLTIPLKIKVEKRNNELIVDRLGEEKQAKASHGSTRAHLVNMITGVTEGWQKKLEIVGTGYGAKKEGEDLVLKLRYSHPVKVKAPSGITFDVAENVITVSGPDKALVGQLADKIKKIQSPDPYKGKGIRYFGEIIKLKPGKIAKGAEGAA